MGSPFLVMNLKTHFLAVLLIVLSIAAQATGKEKEKDAKRSSVRVVKHSETCKLIYVKKLQAKVGVKIFDDAGRLVFSERIINREGFIRPYNFGQLSHGEYTIVITDGDEKIIEKVNHGSAASAEGKPVLQLIKMNEMPDRDKVYHLTIVNQGSAVASISIMNNENEVIFSKNEQLEGNYAQLYNLTELKNGVRFEVTLRNETVTFDL